MRAAYLLSKEVLPHLRKRGGGSIVYISSIAGFDPLGVSIKKDFKLGMYNIKTCKDLPSNYRQTHLKPHICGYVLTGFTTKNSEVYTHCLCSLQFTQ